MNLFLGCQSKADLKARYRSLSLLLHPDQNNGLPVATEAFRQLTAEYEAVLQSVRAESYEQHVEQGQTAYDRRQQKSGFRPKAQKDCWEWMERLSLSDRNAAKVMGKMLIPPAYGEDAFEWYWELKTRIAASRISKPVERQLVSVGALPDFSNPLWEGEY